MSVCIPGRPAPYPFPPPHLHVTLGGIDAVVQGLDGHPAHGETPLGKSGLEGWVKREGLCRGLWGAGPGLEPERGTEAYHCLLHVNLLPARKAKVGNLGGQVLSDQHISGSQVPVDELQARSEVREDWG